MTTFQRWRLEAPLREAERRANRLRIERNLCTAAIRQLERDIAEYASRAANCAANLSILTK